MVVGRLLELELHEHVVDVGFDRLVAHHEPSGDRVVRSAFGHQAQHFVFTLGQLTERIGVTAASYQTRDDRRIDDALPLRDPVEGIGEDGDIREPFLEEISHSLGVFLQQSTGESGIQMVRENEDADLRMGPPSSRAATSPSSV